MPTRRRERSPRSNRFASSRQTASRSHLPLIPSSSSQVFDAFADGAASFSSLPNFCFCFGKHHNFCSGVRAPRHAPIPRARSPIPVRTRASCCTHNLRPHGNEDATNAHSGVSAISPTYRSGVDTTVDGTLEQVRDMSGQGQELWSKPGTPSLEQVRERSGRDQEARSQARERSGMWVREKSGMFQGVMASTISTWPHRGPKMAPQWPHMARTHCHEHMAPKHGIDMAPRRPHAGPTLVANGAN
jgi:hypothetical protein